MRKKRKKTKMSKPVAKSLKIAKDKRNKVVQQKT